MGLKIDLCNGEHNQTKDNGYCLMDFDPLTVSLNNVNTSDFSGSNSGIDHPRKNDHPWKHRGTPPFISIAGGPLTKLSLVVKRKGGQEAGRRI